MITNNNSWSLGTTLNKSLDPFEPSIPILPGDPFVTWATCRQAYSVLNTPRFLAGLAHFRPFSPSSPCPLQHTSFGAVHFLSHFGPLGPFCPLDRSSSIPFFSSLVRFHPVFPTQNHFFHLLLNPHPVPCTHRNSQTKSLIPNHSKSLIP
jgi:hypothetical protein